MRVYNNDGTINEEKVNVYFDFDQQAGWPVIAGTDIRSSPSIADLDKDGSLEVVIGSGDNKVYVFLKKDKL